MEDLEIVKWIRRQTLEDWIHKNIQMFHVEFFIEEELFIKDRTEDSLLDHFKKKAAAQIGLSILESLNHHKLVKLKDEYTRRHYRMSVGVLKLDKD